LSNLGYASQYLGNDYQAKRYYLMALTIQPDLQNAWAEMYNIAPGVGLQRYSEQIKQMTVVPNDSDNSVLVYQLNQTGLEDNPDDYYYLVNRAFMNIRFMRLTDVQADIDKALKNIQRNGVAALLAKAQMYNNMGDFGKAREAYRNCLAVSPQPVAYAELGSIEMQEGHTNEALHDFGKATELGNDKPSWAATYNKLKADKLKRAI
jgi:tetratricopeptide (TPR) repeat protein